MQKIRLASCLATLAALSSCAQQRSQTPEPADLSPAALEQLPLPQLTQRLVALSSAGDRVELMRAVAAARRRKLDRLVANASADSLAEQLLAAALPQRTIDKLPAAAAQLSERRVSFSGAIRRRVLDHDDGSTTLVAQARTAAGWHRLVVPTSLSGKLWDSTGAQGRIEGVALGKTIAAHVLQWGEKYGFGVEPPVGAQPLAVILVNFADNTDQPYTPAEAKAALFTDADSASDWLREFSRGTTWLTGDVFGWYTLDINAADCDTTTLATLAIQKAMENNVDLSGYERFVVGYASAGCTTSASIGGYPSDAIYEGGKLLNRAVVLHELGHNFGMWHTHAMEACDLSATDPLADCKGVDYGHQVCVMGRSEGWGHFAPAQLERLGWLGSDGSEPITDVAASGSYSIEALAAGTMGPKALRIPRSWDSASGTLTYYHVEYRRPVNYDNYKFFENNPSFTGVLVSQVQVGGSNPERYFFMIDMTPSTRGATWDQQLEIGSTFTDAQNGVSIKTVSADGTNAVIEVNLTTPAGSCTRANPSVSASSLHSKLGPGETGVFEVTVTNNDSDCGPSSFAFSTTGLPAGWTSRAVPASWVLPSGASTKLQMRVTAPDTATTPGDKAFLIAATDATDASRIANAAATFNLTNCERAPPTVLIDPATQDGSQDVQLTYALKITNNNSGNCGDVKFSVDDYAPSNWSSSSSDVTVASGATVSTDLKIRPPGSATLGPHYFGAVVYSSAARQRGLVSATALYNVVECVRAAPTVTLAPGSQTGEPGDKKSYTVSITNNDGVCGDQTFDVAATVPAGWAANVSGRSVPAGQTRTVTLSVTPPDRGVSAGSYDVSVEVTGRNSALSGSADASYVVTLPPDLGPPDMGVDVGVPDVGPDTGASPCPTCTRRQVCCNIASLRCYGKCIADCRITGSCPQAGGICDEASGICQPGGVRRDSGVPTPDRGTPDSSQPVPDTSPPPPDSAQPPPPDGGQPPPADSGSPPADTAASPDTQDSPCSGCGGGEVCCDIAGLPCYGQCLPNCNAGGQCPGNAVCAASGICLPPGLRIDSGTLPPADSGTPPPPDSAAPPADSGTPPLPDSAAPAADSGGPPLPDSALPPPPDSRPPTDTGDTPAPDRGLTKPDAATQTDGPTVAKDSSAPQPTRDAATPNADSGGKSRGQSGGCGVAGGRVGSVPLLVLLLIPIGRWRRRSKGHS